MTELCTTYFPKELKAAQEALKNPGSQAHDMNVTAGNKAENDGEEKEEEEEEEEPEPEPED